MRAEVCNHKLEKIGIINNILGPVRAPYVSIQPFVGNAGTVAGRVLYQSLKEWESLSIWLSNWSQRRPSPGQRPLVE